MTDERVTIQPFCEMARKTKRRAVAFQVIGERSSGTNYVHKLLRNSLTLHRETYLGWKHGFPQVAHIRDDFLVVCVVRNAANWILSTHRKPWHTTPAMQRMGFAEFIRAPWESEIGKAGYFNPDKVKRIAGLPLQLDRHPITGAPFANALNLRNLKLAALLGMPNRAPQCAVVQFEHVLANPTGFVRQLKQEFEIGGPEGYEVGEQKLGAKFHASVDDRPSTPTVIGDRDYKFIRRHLDLEQEKAIGYVYRA
ncbi:MAG: hypothetical protein ABI459_04410 [Deltaproteobacteria bacterium]